MYWVLKYWCTSFLLADLKWSAHITLSIWLDLSSERSIISVNLSNTY